MKKCLYHNIYEYLYSLNKKNYINNILSKLF